MPKPFPFPLNIGTDICSIPRIRKILLKATNGPRLVKRVLTERECLETRSRWEAPIERYWQADRRRILLAQKKSQMGLSKDWAWTQTLDIKEKNGWPGDAEKAKLRERDEKAKVVDDEVELELDVDSDRLENEALEDTESSLFANAKVVVEKVPIEDARKGKLSDKEALLLLMVQNIKEMRAAEVGLNLVAQFMAGRFAAKEAVIKAHHNRRLTYHSIAIHQPLSKPLNPLDSVQGSKAPYAVVISESGSWEDGQEVKLSISHDGDYATAVCMAYEPDPSEGPQVSTQDRRKPEIPQVTLSSREAAILPWDEKYHGDRQLQLIQQEIERSQNLNGIDSSGITQGDTVRRVADTPEANETVEMKLPNRFETSTSLTTPRRRASMRSNGAVSVFWNLVSRMGESQKEVLLKTRSQWRPANVLMIDQLPYGTSRGSLKDLIRSVDKNFYNFNLILANDTEGESLGFAFVRFRTATTAKLALEKARLFILNGKPLVCRWMGKSHDFDVSEKSAEGSIEGPTPQSHSPIEESDSERTNVDVEVPHLTLQPSPVKTLTMAQRTGTKRTKEGLRKGEETMISRGRAESLFGGSMDGFSEAQLSSVLGMLQYGIAQFLRLDNLPAETSRNELERLLDMDYWHTIRRTVLARGTAIVFFVSQKEAMDASIRLGPTFTLHGATVTCTWLGGMPQEATTQDKDLDTETIEDAQDSVEKSVKENENTQVHIEDSSLQKALDAFYSRGRKPRRGSGITRRTRRNSTR